MSTDSQTSHRQNLTRERARLRTLHQATNPRPKIEYLGHTIHREAHDETQSGCYHIKQDGEFVDAVEPSDFVHADDWVRYVDLVIQHGRSEAKDWLRNELRWGWDE